MKLKTHSGMKKRIKVTGRKKLLMSKANKRHLLVNKSKRQKKSGRLGLHVFSGDAANVRRMLGI